MRPWCCATAPGRAGRSGGRIFLTCSRRFARKRRSDGIGVIERDFQRVSHRGKAAEVSLRVQRRPTVTAVAAETAATAAVKSGYPPWTLRPCRRLMNSLDGRGEGTVEG